MRQKMLQELENATNGAKKILYLYFFIKNYTIKSTTLCQADVHIKKPLLGGFLSENAKRARKSLKIMQALSTRSLS